MLASPEAPWPLPRQRGKGRLPRQPTADRVPLISVPQTQRAASAQPGAAEPSGRSSAGPPRFPAEAGLEKPRVSPCGVSVLTQPGPLRSGWSVELSTASRTLPRGRGGSSHALLPHKTTFITSKHMATLAQSSPQGCGFAQQLDRYWIKRTRSPQPSLPLPGAGALALPF